MLSLTLLSLALSVAASEIQSTNPAFFSAGLQGCIAVESNTDGAPVVIHNCNEDNGDNAVYNWNVSFFDRQNAGPQAIQVHGDKCIDVTGGVNADGTKLQIWTCVEGSKNQQWTSVTDGTFQWSGTNKCIDLTGGAITDGTQLQIWTCTDGSNQKWVGTSDPDNQQSVHITGGDFSAGGGGPYCIAAASNQVGAEVALVNCLNSDFHTTFPDGNITWLAPVAPLTGAITTFQDKCLSVPNSNQTNGVKLTLENCLPRPTNQLWTNNGSQIQWAGTDFCIDLTDGASTNGNPIQIWECARPDNNKNQDWFLSSV